ncbi:hypothetical protein CMI37_28460 [Candidatus Pacearchaeota archaeon]|nr:hypothetical protein [Candidatus Pacearchaeota archaeon]|tara:strand:- start:343 stop:531 length:189 start_codon:yes stop_codon:yes gene_type:complete
MKKIILEILGKYASVGAEQEVANLTSPAAREMIAEDICALVKKRFHVFRKNELLWREDEKKD